LDFTDKNIVNYSLEHSDAEDVVLAELQRETHLTFLSPRMLSGHLQGKLLTLLASSLQAKSILEIGTYTGYSAICLAKGLSENGKLITIDINEETETIAKKYFIKSGLNYKIESITGNALKVIPNLDIHFDLVFIDADKKNYLNYYHLVFDKVRQGGLIIADNVLWSGKVLDEAKQKDVDTKSIIEFNTFIKNDVRIEKLMLPVRDGLFIIRKK
jgi:predicted O-methyltransferase YrrM